MGLLDRFRGKPTLDSFARELMSSARKAGCPDELRYDPQAKLILRERNGEPCGQIAPANMFRAYLDVDKAERKRLMASYVRACAHTDRELPEDYEVAKVDLRPRLWNRASVEMLRAQGTAPDLVAVPLGHHILASVVYDWPETVQSIPSGQLEKWGVTPYQALEDATANLSTATEGFAVMGESLYTFIAGDSYDASRILLSDWLERMETKGRKVAMVPNRDAAMVTGEDDELGLTMMAALAEEALGAAYALSAVPMVWEDGEWRDWTPAEEHPMRAKFAEMRAQMLGALYERQKAMLEEKHQKEGVDVFVASFSGGQRPDGSSVSYSVWGEGPRMIRRGNYLTDPMFGGLADPNPYHKGRDGRGK
ncbi:DUF1444 family protein [Paludisphaera soli]|uniref:DUF1444 family protein n=1 Tax=Paludisphaera soli TaxID=2712865 RepID=UPI0013ECD4A2|nr:DUF1444 family protein [Paludisphaera soli]